MSERLSLGGRRGLYAIVDPDFCPGGDALAVAEAVLRGGCAILQLRAKAASDAELRALGDALLPLCHARGVPFVINDRPEVALAVGADGVHLGQTDMPVERARALCGPLAIGLSTHGPEQAATAVRAGADLIGFGPVFATASKRDPDPVVGLASLSEVVARTPIPVVAIGGIDADNATAVAATGAPLAAVISAVCRAPDPERAAARLHVRLQREPAAGAEADPNV